LMLDARSVASLLSIAPSSKRRATPERPRQKSRNKIPARHPQVDLPPPWRTHGYEFSGDESGDGPTVASPPADTLTVAAGAVAGFYGLSPWLGAFAAFKAGVVAPSGAEDANWHAG
jgi:hypothetical protein